MTTKKSKMPRSVQQLESRRPNTTWILLMQRGRAKILRQSNSSGDIELVEGFVNPAGELQNIELVTDKPGRIDRTSGGFGGHSAAPAEDAHEHALTSFAKALAERLEAGLVSGECHRLVIAAEPHCLGRLKSKLGKNSKKHIRAAIPKDFFLLSERELAGAVADLG